jgi:hypothetical protein
MLRGSLWLSKSVREVGTLCRVQPATGCPQTGWKPCSGVTSCTFTAVFTICLAEDVLMAFKPARLSHGHCAPATRRQQRRGFMATLYPGW